MAVTHKEIARHVGVSTSLVGMALNENPRVSEVTRMRIKEAARQLGYDAGTNREARKLIARRYGQRVRSGLIAVLSLSETGRSFQNISYELPVLEGIESELKQRGLDMLFYVPSGTGLPHFITQGEADGVLCLSAAPEILQQLRALSFPTIKIGSSFPGLHSVRPDDEAGICRATSHLLDLGHRNIAYIGHSPTIPEHLSVLSETATRRLQGFRRAFAERGLAIPELLVDSSVRIHKEASTNFQRLLNMASPKTSAGTPRPFTAVVCYNDVIAMEVVHQARILGLRVPDDLSVTGFDNTTTETHFQPAITSIHFARYEMGQQAVRLLGEALDEESGATHAIYAGDNTNGSADAAKPELKREILPVELVQHETTAPPNL